MKASLARRSRPPLTGERPPSPPRPLSLEPGIYTGRREESHAQKRPLLGEENSRWLSSLLIVLVVYAAPLAWWLNSPETPGVNAPPPAAMVVELAPLPVAPPPEQLEEPQPPEPEPEPPKVEPEPMLEPKKEAKVALPQEETPPPDKPKEEPKEKPEEQADTPPDVLQEDDVAAAPERGAPAPVVNSNRVPNWQNQLLLKLNEAKRYPARARRYRQEGIAYLRFTMDRNGQVLEKSIDQSSGYRLLDREALALLERAQPLPKPPAEKSGETIEFVVPVEFFLNR